MSSVIHRNHHVSPAGYTIAIAAFLVAAILVGPATARAEDIGAATAPMHDLPQQAGGQGPEVPIETVAQRISRLHEELKITAGEEEKWEDVAKAMKDNAEAMERLIKERDNHASGKMTAVQDLKEYQKFTQTHATALSNLIYSFEALYNSMPEPQRAVADDVFEKFGQKGVLSHN